MENLKSYKNPVVVAFGNPLLDICIQAPENENICEEFGLSLDGEAEVSADDAKKLQERTDSYFKTLCCGGSALNSSRVLQWLLAGQNNVTFAGTVGEDANGKLICQMISKDGVIAKCAKHPSLPTGVTTVLVHGSHRSLVAYIGAAEVYDEDYLSQELISNIRSAQIVLMEAYFSFHNLSVCRKVVQECHRNGTCFVFALSSIYLYESPDKDLLKLVKCADIVIGNDREFRALLKALGKEESDIKDVVRFILDWGFKNDSVPLKLKNLRSKGKVVVCTRGKNSIICGEQHSRAITSIPVPKVDNVVDGTGAGDSFAGGLLLGILLQKDFITCAQLGMYASGEIIQQVGCAIPEHSPKTLDPKSKVGALIQ